MKCVLFQVFVPFISDVRVGGSSSGGGGQDPEQEEGGSSGPHSLLPVPHLHHSVAGGLFLDRPGRGTATSGGGPLSGTLSTGGGAAGGGGERLTPPSSPNISKYAFDAGERSRSESDRAGSSKFASTGSAASGENSDLMELQLDYWLNEKMAVLLRGGDNGGSEHQRRSESESKPRGKPLDPKSSIRTTFRSLSITHLASGMIGSSDHCFAMTYVTKEKRLGKAVLKIGKKKVS